MRGDSEGMGEGLGGGQRGMLNIFVSSDCTDKQSWIPGLGEETSSSSEHCPSKES